METEKKDNTKKPYNIVVPFNIPGKPDIGLLDLNEIFKLNINYNFDALKSLLEGLVSSYKKSEEELENIKAHNKVKDIKIKELEQKMLDLNILLSNSLGNTEEVEKLKEMKLKLEKEEIIEQSKVKEKPQIIKNVETKESGKVNITVEKPMKRQLIKSSVKRKKIHAPINKDIKLDIQIGSDDITNKIIVSIFILYYLIYFIINFYMNRKK